MYTKILTNKKKCSRKCFEDFVAYYFEYFYLFLSKRNTVLHMYSRVIYHSDGLKIPYNQKSHFSLFTMLNLSVKTVHMQEKEKKFNFLKKKKLKIYKTVTLRGFIYCREVSNIKTFYFLLYKQKKVLVFENFRLPVFDGFTRFGMP